MIGKEEGSTKLGRAHSQVEEDWCVRYLEVEEE